MRERFEEVVRFLLSLSLVGLDELQSADLDRELSSASVSVAFAGGKTTRTPNIPRASLRELSHCARLMRISSRLR